MATVWQVFPNVNTQVNISDVGKHFAYYIYVHPDQLADRIGLM